MLAAVVEWVAICVAGAYMAVSVAENLAGTVRGSMALGIENACVTRVDLRGGLQVLAAGAAFAFWRSRRAAAVIGLVVFSHWR